MDRHGVRLPCLEPRLEPACAAGETMTEREVSQRVRLRDPYCRLCGDRHTLTAVKLLPGPYTPFTAGSLCRSCRLDLTRVDRRMRVEPVTPALGCNGRLDVVAL